MLSAIVTDPQGVDDVIGGTLESPTGALYTSFATSASEGSYGANLDWNSIHQVDTIEFRVSKEIVPRRKIFDQAANATSRTLTIRLECSDAGNVLAMQAASTSRTASTIAVPVSEDAAKMVAVLAGNAGVLPTRLV